MLDDTRGAYGWAINVEYKNRENPDFLAIIATVIELLYRDGKKYKVSDGGAVSKR
jgi:hypothetical protein